MIRSSGLFLRISRMFPSALLVVFNMWVLVLILMLSVAFSSVTLKQICVAFSNIICFCTVRQFDASI